MSDPVPPDAGAVPPPAVDPTSSATPVAAGPPAEPAEPPGPSSDGSSKVPVWLVATIVGVVVVVVAVVIGVLALGGDDGDTADVQGALSTVISMDDASTPVVRMLPETQWDLDSSVVTTSFGNTCFYSSPESPLQCTLIGGDPDRRQDLAGADVANTSPIATPPVDASFEVVGDAELVGGSFAGCPGSVRLTGPDDPLGPGPAVCVLTDQARVFAIYQTHVEPDGALSFVAVEVTP